MRMIFLPELIWICTAVFFFVLMTLTVAVGTPKISDSAIEGQYGSPSKYHRWVRHTDQGEV